MLNVAKDGGTYIITASFTDEDGAAVTPNTLQWTLINNNRQIVNSRENVSVIPASTVTIVLTTDDLLLSDGDERRIKVYATYDSTNGSDLVVVDSAQFFIEDDWA